MSIGSDYYVYMYVRSIQSEYGDVGSPYYVGKGRGCRAWEYRKHSIRRPTDLAHVVFASRDMTEAEAFAEEIALIAKYGRIDKGTGCLRNQTDGGEGASGCFKSEETRKKISEAKKGKPGSYTKFKPGHVVSEETNRRMSAARKGVSVPNGKLRGRKRDPETLEKMSIAIKSAWERRRLSGKPLGKPHTEEAKMKISLATKGISKPHKGQVFSAETRAKMSTSQTLRYARERKAP